MLSCPITPSNNFGYSCSTALSCACSSLSCELLLGCDIFIKVHYSHAIPDRKRKRHKSSHKATEVVGEITNRDGELVPIRVLLDTGTTSTILLRKFVHKIRTNKAQPGRPLEAHSTQGGRHWCNSSCLSSAHYNNPALSSCG